MANITLIGKVKSFVTSQVKGGSTGLVMVRDCIEHWRDHNDWTPLAWLIAKSDKTDSLRYRKIVSAVVDGIKLETTSAAAKAQPSGMRFVKTDKFAVSNKYSVLCDLVENKVSFRSKAIDEALFDKKDATEYSLVQAAAAYKRFLAKLEEGHLTLTQVLNLVAEGNKVNKDLIEKPTAPAKAPAKSVKVKAVRKAKVQPVKEAA